MLALPLIVHIVFVTASSVTVFGSNTKCAQMYSGELDLNLNVILKGINVKTLKLHLGCFRPRTTPFSPVNYSFQLE